MCGGPRCPSPAPPKPCPLAGPGCSLISSTCLPLLHKPLLRARVFSGAILAAYAQSSAHPCSPQPLSESEDFWEPTSLDRPQPLPEPSPSSPAPGHPGPASSVAVRNPRNLQEVDKNPCEWEGSRAPGPPPPPRPGHTLGRARPSPRAHRREGGWGLWADQDSVLPHATPTAPFPGPHVGAPGPRGLRPSLTGGAACLQSACHATSSPGARHRPTCHRLCPRAALGRQAAGRGHWSWSAQ